jgi:hypothetical protein
VLDTAGLLRSQNGAPGTSSSASSSSSPSAWCGREETKGISGRSTMSDADTDDEMDNRDVNGSLFDKEEAAV